MSATSELIEQSVLLKILYNPELQVYLDDMLPGTFIRKDYRMIIFAMIQLRKKEIKITVNNIKTYLTIEKDAETFRRKAKAPRLTPEEIEGILINDALDQNTSKEMFDKLYPLLLEGAFYNYAELRMGDVNYYLSYPDKVSQIAASCASVSRLADVLFKRKHKNINNPFRDVAQFINDSNVYIPTFSREINAKMHGWSRGYPNSILARSQHCKSTFITNEVRHKVKKNLVDKVAIISTEERQNVYYARLFCAEFLLSSSKMRAGITKITDDQVNIMEKIYKGRLEVFDGISYYKDVIDLLNSLRDYELIFIDHINMIKFPGSGNDLQNMPGGIASLITDEKRFLEKAKDTSIINLNQVKEKDIESIRDRWKKPPYTMAYGSTTTYFAAREWLTLYYPYKDVMNRGIEWIGAEFIPTVNDLFVSIEKSSFSELGEIQLKYEPEHFLLNDLPPQTIQSTEELLQEKLFND